MNPGNHWVKNFCLNFFYFVFILLLYFRHLDCCKNSVKQTASLNLNLRLKPEFLVRFCYFWKVKSLLDLNLFISEYLDQIPPWKGIKEAFSVKLQTENCCFCFRQKLNKTQTAQIRNTMQSSSTFIKMSGPKQVRFVPNTGLFAI